MAKLIIKEGERKRIYEICEDTLHIGSTPENNIRLRGDDISRVHCEIKKTPQGYRIIDLESKVGTKVNGDHVNQHVLKHGDRIQVGAALMQFHAGSQAAMTNLEPRESIRMEKARGGKGMHPGAIVGIGLGVVALLVALVMYAKSDTQLPGRRLIERAERLLKSTDPDTVRRGIALLDDYDDLRSGDKSNYTDELYADLRKDAKIRLETFAAEARLAASHAAYLEMNKKLMPLVNDGRYDEAIVMAKAFNEQYPENARFMHLVKSMKRWESKMTGGAKNSEEVFAKIIKLMDDEEYGEAKRIIETYSRKWKRGSNKERLNKLYKDHGNRTVDAWKRFTMRKANGNRFWLKPFTVFRPSKRSVWSLFSARTGISRRHKRFRCITKSARFRSQPLPYRSSLRKC